LDLADDACVSTSLDLFLKRKRKRKNLNQQPKHYSCHYSLNNKFRYYLLNLNKIIYIYILNDKIINFITCIYYIGFLNNINVLCIYKYASRINFEIDFESSLIISIFYPLFIK
jgi:hypothetical protein